VNCNVVGVAISGYPNSGFVRSLGYEGFAAGFPGFLLWSGSALPGSAGTKGGAAYSGVGLELYANTASYFRYATANSEIDVRTNRFFFGNPATTFISGANGNVEISASGFHLTAQGNVTASSFVAIQGGQVLFDSNSEFVDGLNIGRIVYFDQTEYTYNMATLPTTASGITGSHVAGPSFETFILPGETNMQMSYTFYIDRTDTTFGNRTLQISSFIASAVTGSQTGLGSYGTFNNQAQLLQQSSIASAASASQYSGANTVEIKGAASGITNRQGHYVLVHTQIEASNIVGLTGTLKLKNFVFRTSRTVGGSILAPANPVS